MVQVTGETERGEGMERLIDEKRLIEDLIKCKELGRKSFEAVLKIIEEQAKVNCSRREWYQKGYQDGLNANRWIPCSERLPTKYDNLLICQSDGYVNVGYYSLNGFKDMNSYPYKDVIAWQPLPEPYKGE